MLVGWGRRLGRGFTIIKSDLSPLIMYSLYLEMHHTAARVLLGSSEGLGKVEGGDLLPIAKGFGLIAGDRCGGHVRQTHEETKKLTCRQAITLHR